MKGKFFFIIILTISIIFPKNHALSLGENDYYPGNVGDRLYSYNINDCIKINFPEATTEAKRIAQIVCEVDGSKDISSFSGFYSTDDKTSWHKIDGLKTEKGTAFLYTVDLPLSQPGQRVYYAAISVDENRNMNVYYDGSTFVLKADNPLSMSYFQDNDNLKGMKIDSVSFHENSKSLSVYMNLKEPVAPEKEIDGKTYPLIMGFYLFPAGINLFEASTDKDGATNVAQKDGFVAYYGPNVSLPYSMGPSSNNKGNVNDKNFAVLDVKKIQVEKSNAGFLNNDDYSAKLIDSKTISFDLNKDTINRGKQGDLVIFSFTAYNYKAGTYSPYWVDGSGFIRLKQLSNMFYDVK